MADYRLDEETRKSLLGLMPFTQNGTMNFIPKAFDGLPDGVRAVFKQRAYTRQEFATVKNAYTDETIKDKQSALWSVSRGTVLGWDKLFDLATGEPMEYKADADGGMDKDLWESLPPIIRWELTTNASVMSGLLERERVALKS
jgi:hypothetical protein